MKSGHILSSLSALAAVASAMPTSPAKDTGRLIPVAPQSSASGCEPYEAYKPCCLPAYCRCSNGWYYLYNPDNKKAGGNGCDPPWGFLGKELWEFPSYCPKNVGCMG